MFLKGVEDLYWITSKCIMRSFQLNRFKGAIYFLSARAKRVSGLFTLR